jgi:sec-independent protein translocase protein TatA
MPFKLGPLELVLILVIVMVVFGVGKLPQIGTAIGKSIRAFKEGQTSEEEEAQGKKTTRKRVRKTTRKTTTEAPLVKADKPEDSKTTNAFSNN